jgi:FixJ family two-component response regulator
LQTTPIVSIVDDDESSRLALSNLVRSLGFQVRLYESAEEFLTSGGVVDAACLISDICMPGMSGLDMYEHLIAQGYVPRTIFVSAYPTPSLRARAASTGALVLLEKPYPAAVMTHWLTIALGRP